MMLSVILILITLSGSDKFGYCSNQDSDLSQRIGEELDYIPHVETTLDFRGNIRKLFILELGLEKKEQNIICSPLSAMIPLAKLLLGAKRNSKSTTELLDALGLRHSHELKCTYKQILKEIEYLKGVQTSLVSRIYISRHYKLTPYFKNVSQSIFGSAIELIDTTRPDQVVDTINYWVDAHTNGAIRNLLNRDDISHRSSLVLVNAIYFRGIWKVPFRSVVRSIFFSPSGIVNASMMRVTGSFNYFECRYLNAQIIELPYHGEQSALIIVLPNENNGLPILLRTLKISYELLNTALKKMKTTLVDITIPKFHIETTIDLRHYYKKMGVKYSLVQEHSGLKKVVKHHTVHISAAMQKAIIDVTEIGTVATAVSVFQLIAKVGSIEFTANHPFLFYIRAGHEQLFGGVVNQPLFNSASK